MAQIAERKGPWKICKQEAKFIIRHIIGPILAMGDKLSNHYDEVERARDIARLDHHDHTYDDFAYGGGGRAANPKRRT